jgi:glucose/arabinose dehydrogenase
MIRHTLTAICTAILALGTVEAALLIAPAAAPAVSDPFYVTEYADLSPPEYGSYRNPRALAVGPEGRVYVATLHGRIYAFKDTDGDDQQDEHQLFATGLYFPTGMAWGGEEGEEALYVTVPGEVRVLQDLTSDGDAMDAGENEQFVGDLPESLSGLAFDLDGRLYVGVAAGCDACDPDDLSQGAVLRFDTDGTVQVVLYAHGLHDPHDVGFYPGTDDLFAPDDGRDDLGPDAPLDEWNFVQYGRHYGWPHCWEGGSDPGWELFCTWSADPLVTFPAHSSPAGMAFHDGTAIPSAYANNAFVAIRDLGEVYRVIVTPGGAIGYTATTEPFATGFEEPIDVAVGPDGALYVADYADLKVYCRCVLENGRARISGTVRELPPCGSIRLMTIVDSDPVSYWPQSGTHQAPPAIPRGEHHCLGSPVWSSLSV